MSREYPEHPLLGVGAVIIDKDRALLIRRATPPLLGEWSVPGGLLEIGETLKDGLIREVREETGLDVEVGPVLELFDSIFRDAEGRCQYHYVIVDYLCMVTGGELHAGSDASEAIWIRESEIEKMKLRDTIASVLRKGFQVARQQSTDSDK